MNQAAPSARVLLVDDNQAVLRQVAQLMSDEFTVIGTLHEGSALEDAVTTGHPDIVVLDVTLPGASGFALASRLAGRAQSPKIVFLTVHDDPDYVRAAFAAGAMAYVVKTRLCQDLVAALHAVLEGKRFVSPLTLS
jgi:DNA-binding NarL/FixJ family response regulator